MRKHFGIFVGGLKLLGITKKVHPYISGNAGHCRKFKRK